MSPYFLPVLCTRQEGVPDRIPVIFLDTDAGNDIDDVLLCKMFFNYEKAGK